MIWAPKTSKVVPINCRNGAFSSRSCERIVALSEYQVLRAPIMLNVPKVTMKGGICSFVTRAPLRKPNASAAQQPERKGDKQRHSVVDREAPHHDRRDHHDHADRKIDAGGQDHQSLRDAEQADDRHLGQHRRKIAGGDECDIIDDSCRATGPRTSTTKGTVVG